MTTRIPSLSDSSRSALIPSSFPSFTSSAMSVMSLALLTWYGSSVTTIWDLLEDSFSSMSARARIDASASGLLVILDSGAAVDVSAGREVGTLDQLSDVAGSHLRIVDQRREGGDDFTEVVRWDVGRHADRDSRGSVHDEIGNGRGKNFGLEQPVVEVRREIDGVLVDVGEHLHRHAGKSRLG